VRGSPEEVAAATTMLSVREAALCMTPLNGTRLSILAVRMADLMMRLRLTFALLAMSGSPSFGVTSD
jgi:hypothetical protein